MNEQEIQELRRQVWDLKGEVTALQAQLSGDIPTATVWLQTKVWRQRKALDTLQRRVVNQRATLRTLDELGRSLTTAEFTEYLRGKPGHADTELEPVSL